MKAQANGIWPLSLDKYTGWWKKNAWVWQDGLNASTIVYPAARVFEAEFGTKKTRF